MPRLCVKLLDRVSFQRLKEDVVEEIEQLAEGGCGGEKVADGGIGGVAVTAGVATSVL